MNKAILIIDMPKSCGKCPLCQGVAIDGQYVCSIFDKDSNEQGYEYGKYDKSAWCPLQEPPERQMVWCDDDDWSIGYNACLDWILGEDND